MKKVSVLFSDIFVVFAVIFLAASLIVFPYDSVEAAKRGVDMCLYVVIPSLFPFFVVATLATETGLSRKISKSASYIMKPLFGLGGSCAVPFILGLIGGYPVGTKATVELYKSGSCTKHEAERLLGFCNNSGPAFIFGIIGGFIFGSVKAGAIIYTIHILTSVLIGVTMNIVSPLKEEKSSRFISKTQSKKPLSSSFIVSVTSALMSMINISGFIIFFAVLICILSISGIIPYLSNLLSFFTKNEMISYSLLSGIIEMTSGICSISLFFCSVPAAAAAASFLLGWAGLSVHCQILSITAETDLSVKTLYIGKAVHGILSSAISFLVFSNISEEALDMTAFAPSAPYLYLSSFKTVIFLSVIIVALCAAAALFFKIKKSYGKA